MRLYLLLLLLVLLAYDRLQREGRFIRTGPAHILLLMYPKTASENIHLAGVRWFQDRGGDPAQAFRV